MNFYYFASWVKINLFVFIRILFERISLKLLRIGETICHFGCCGHSVWLIWSWNWGFLFRSSTFVWLSSMTSFWRSKYLWVSKYTVSWLDAFKLIVKLSSVRWLRSLRWFLKWSGWDVSSFFNLLWVLCSTRFFHDWK